MPTIGPLLALKLPLPLTHRVHNFHNVHGDHPFIICPQQVDDLMLPHVAVVDVLGQFVQTLADDRSVSRVDDLGAQRAQSIQRIHVIVQIFEHLTEIQNSHGSGGHEADNG